MSPRRQAGDGCHPALGLGVGTVASHLFHYGTTKIGLSRGVYLRGYEYDFIELFAPRKSGRAASCTCARRIITIS